jgi:UDP-N-acetylglucosamine acyltransferase
VDKNNTFKKRPSFEEGFFNLEKTYIHPTSIIGKNVTIADNVKIGPFSTIVGNISIDSGSRIHGYTSIGMPAQDTNTCQSLGKITIGKNCEIREFVTIGAPLKNDGTTYIGNNCYIMNFSHIAHDVTLEQNVILINNVNLAGHVHIEKHCMLMANTAIHQFCRVGAYSALAPFSGMRQDITPFSLFNGTPGKFAGLNVIGLRRSGFSPEERGHIKTVTKLFFQEKLSIDKIKEITEQDDQLKNSTPVKQFVEFVKNSSRGIPRKTIND